MSLLADVLRDLDRRSPRRTGAGRPGSGRERRERTGDALLAAAGLVAALALVSAPLVWRLGTAGAPRAPVAEAPSVPVSSAPPVVGSSGLPVDVSSPPPARDGLEDAKPRWHGPASLDRLRVEGDREHVRVRLEIDGPLSSEPRPSFDGTELRLVLPGTRVGPMLEPQAVTLADAPWLRALDLLETDTDVVVRARLAGDVDVRTRLVRTRSGALVALDLSAASPPLVLAPAPLPEADPPVPVQEEPVQPDPPVSVQADPSGPAQAGPGADAEVAPRLELRRRPASAQERADAAYHEARRLLRAGGDAARAERLLVQALETAPAHAAAREALAHRWIGTGRRDEARALIREGIAHGGAPGLVELLARLLADEGRPAEALARLDEAGPGDAADPEREALRAALLQDLDRPAEAAAAWRRVLALDARRATAWMGLGIALEALAEPEQARTAYRAALRVGGLESTPAGWVAGRVAALGAPTAAAPR